MKKTLLKFLYKRYRGTFLDFAVEEFYGSMPKSMTEPVLTILAEKRPKLDQFLLYQAFLVQRRIAKTRKEVDTFMGMLLQIKLFMHFISTSSAVPEEIDGAKPMAKFLEEREKIEKERSEAIEGAKKFITKEK